MGRRSPRRRPSIAAIARRKARDLRVELHLCQLSAAQKNPRQLTTSYGAKITAKRKKVEEIDEILLTVEAATANERRRMAGDSPKPKKKAGRK